MNKRVYTKRIIRNVFYLGLIFIFALAYLGISALKSNSHNLPLIGSKNNKTTVIPKQLYINEIKRPNYEEDRSGVGIRFEGQTVNFKSSIYVETNRYYIPVNQLIQSTGGEFDVNDDGYEMILGNSEIKANILRGLYAKRGDIFNFRKPVTVIDNNLYMSIFDLVKAFDLGLDWDVESNTLSFYKKSASEEMNTKSNYALVTGKKLSLLRLEDVYPGFKYGNPEALMKLRALADMLESHRVPFHVAWVPRYVDPKNKIDINLCTDENMYNADFIYTLDYMIDRGGIFGLHGYTHQFGEEPTYDGAEFGKNVYSSVKEAKERMEKAMEFADKLDIPYVFFEAPHYSGTIDQFKAFEQYFDYIYEPDPKHIKEEVLKKKIGNRVVRYIPTPLGYIRGEEDIKEMETQVQNIKDKQLASFFFHPFLDFDFIDIKSDLNGHKEAEYSREGILARIMKIYEKDGYRFERITNLE